MKSLSILSGLLFCVGSAIFLAGCASKPPLKRGAVQSQWATTFRELGIIPTFPPREDLMVGDIFLQDFDPNSAYAEEIFLKPWQDLTETEKAVRQSMGMSTRALRLDLQKALSDDYQKSFAAPPTTAEYNSILGNPAIAAASAEVERIASEIKKLDESVTAADKKSTDAVKAHTAATQEKARIDVELTTVKSDLAAAQAKPVDVAAEEQAVAVIQERIWTIDRNLIVAREQQKQVGTDKDKKAAADAEVAKWEYEKSLATHEQTVANARLATARLKKTDTVAAQTKVDELTAKQTESATKVLGLDQEKTNAATDLANLKASTQPKIETLKAKLTKAEEIKTAVGAAGAKLLYPEPTFGAEDLFVGEKLDEKTLAASKVSRVNRLRVVAFPEFSAVSVASADLSALVPIDALGVGLNVSAESVSQVSVKIPAAESYAISLADIYPRIIKGDKLASDVLEVLKVAKVLYPRGFVAPSPIASSSGGPGNPGAPQKNKGGLFSRMLASVKRTPVAVAPPTLHGEADFVYLRIVTEVFYARAIDVGLFASKSFGGRLSVNSPSKTEDGKPAEKEFTDAAVAKAPDLLAQIADRLSTTQMLPGGSIQLLSKNESSIGIRRIFDRPVAVGWRGIVLKVKLDGTVVGAEIGTGMIPAPP